jgi:hypothetical protein
MTFDATVWPLLLALGTAPLHEAMRPWAMGQRGAVDSTIRPLNPRRLMVGRALTVNCRPDDNLALHCALAITEPRGCDRRRCQGLSRSRSIRRSDVPLSHASQRRGLGYRRRGSRFASHHRHGLPSVLPRRFDQTNLEEPARGNRTAHCPRWRHRGGGSGRPRHRFI